MSKKTSKRSYSTKSGQTGANAKQPLVSTGKKIAIAMYFTFLATLALVLGAQIWLKDIFNPNTQTNNPNLVPQQETTQYQETNQIDNVEQQNSTQSNDIDPNFYVENNKDFLDNNQVTNNSYNLNNTANTKPQDCPNGNCDM